MPATAAATRSASAAPPPGPRHREHHQARVEHDADGCDPDRDPAREFVKEGGALPSDSRGPPDSGAHRTRGAPDSRGPSGPGSRAAWIASAAVCG